MNRNHSFLKILKIMILTIILSFNMQLYAKEIDLYDQPKANAKAIATIDLSAGIIPIYTAKEGGWVKIADPKNGNVGWIKSSYLNTVGTSQSILTFTHSMYHKSPITYRIFQHGQPTKLTSEQTQKIIKQVQIEQQEMQKSIQMMMRDMDKLLYNDWHFLPHDNIPFFVPVVIMPAPKTSQLAQVKKHQTSPTVTATKQHNDQIKK